MRVATARRVATVAVAVAVAVASASVASVAASASAATAATAATAPAVAAAVGPAGTAAAVTLAAADLSPWIGIPLAAVALVLLVWHHDRLGRDDVPAPRRRVRRAATWAMAAGVLAMTVALCFADPAVHPMLFVVSWSAVMAVLAIVIVLAVVDVAVSSWLAGIERDEAAIRRGVAVLAALEEEAVRRAAGPHPDHQSDQPPDQPPDQRPGGRPGPASAPDARSRRGDGGPGAASEPDDPPRRGRGVAEGREDRAADRDR